MEQSKCYNLFLIYRTIFKMYSARSSLFVWVLLSTLERKAVISIAEQFFYSGTVFYNCTSMCAIRMWRNKGSSEPKLLAFDAEYRMNARKKMSDAAEVRGPIERAEWKRDNYRHFRVVLPRVAFRVSSLFFFTESSARAFIKINFDADLTDSWFTDFEIGSRDGLERSIRITIKRCMIWIAKYEWISPTAKICALQIKCYPLFTVYLSPEIL